MTIRRGLAFLVALLLSFGAQAADTSPKHDKIRTILLLSGTYNETAQIINTLSQKAPIAAIQNRASLPPGFVYYFNDEFKNQINAFGIHLENFHVSFYDKNYSEDELDQLIAFLSSPVGKKGVELLPRLKNEAISFAQVSALEMISRAMEQATIRFKDQPQPTPPQPAKPGAGL